MPSKEASGFIWAKGGGLITSEQNNALRICSSIEKMRSGQRDPLSYKTTQCYIICVGSAPIFVSATAWIKIVIITLGSKCIVQVASQESY